MELVLTNPFRLWLRCALSSAAPGMILCTVPELPDIIVYLDSLKPRILGQTLTEVRVANPFLLRTAVPPLHEANNRKVTSLRRIGKRVVIGLETDLWLVLHLMIAGRLHWREQAAKLSPKYSIAAFEFPHGSLQLTEAGTKKRASLYFLRGEQSLQTLDPGGLEVLDCSLEAFTQALASENHTLKRALTDPHLFSGIGNAYSDEILHAAKLSPLALTQKLSRDAIAALHHATQHTLTHWITFLRNQTGDGFLEDVTAFRPEMAVHGKFGQLCPVCGNRVQRIRYADNETNYCPHCQTGGKLLADRGLSLLLKRDWPKTPEELEELRGKGAPSKPANKP